MATKSTSQTKTRKKKVKKIVPATGRASVNATFNNTIITVADQSGNTIAWGSSGTVGFKGARKSTPFAATKVAEEVAIKASELGVKEVDVFVKGPGMGRDGAVRGLRTGGLRVLSIADVTPIPHNGCRPKKRRRV